MSNEFRDGLTENLQIINALKSYAITNITRISDPYSIERYKKKIDTVKQSEIFNLLPSVLLFHLENGDIIGFYGDDLKDSVVTWFDTCNGIEDDTTYYYRDWAEYMSYNDPIYSTDDNWSHMIGQKVNKIQVLTIERGEIKRFPDSLQRAIILETNRGDMVISFCLLNLPSGSSFPLTRKADLPSELWGKALITEL